MDRCCIRNVKLNDLLFKTLSTVATLHKALASQTRRVVITHCLLLKKPDLRSSTSSIGEEEERSELSDGLREGELLSPCSTDRELGRSSNDWQRWGGGWEDSGREHSGRNRSREAERRTSHTVEIEAEKAFRVCYCVLTCQHVLFIKSLRLDIYVHVGQRAYVLGALGMMPAC